MSNEVFALLGVLRKVVYEIRLMGYEGKNIGLSAEESELVGDLADAIHNIPDAVLGEDFDLNFHTEIMLGGFEEKYGDRARIKPLALYQQYLK